MNLVKKSGQENCCQKNGQKNVGPKKFLVSNNFARKKLYPKIFGDFYKDCGSPLPLA